MVMGKKKPQKTKELSVAIAEASSTGEDPQQPQTHQQNQPQTPRKRGRPRKIAEKKEISQEIKQEEIVEQAGGKAEISESSLKKGKTSEGEGEEQETEKEQHHVQQEGGSSACIQLTKDPTKGEPSRSRARRKSKPRKSS